MSVEDKTSSIPTSEEDVEVQQESPQSFSEGSAFEVETVVEQFQSDFEDGIRNSGATDDIVADETTGVQSNLQDSIKIGGIPRQEKQESLLSIGGNGTESQQDGIRVVDSVVQSQEGGAEFQQNVTPGVVESQQGGEPGVVESPEMIPPPVDAKEGGSSPVESPDAGSPTTEGGVTDSFHSQLSMKSTSIGNICEESLQRRSSFQNSKFPCVTRDLGRQHYDDISTGSASTGDSQETAIVGKSSRRASLESGVAGDISNSPDLQDSVPAGCSIASGSKKAVAVGDISNQASLESGAAGDVSNSPDSQESPAIDTGSWEGVAAPLPPAAYAIPSGQRPIQTFARRNEYEREQVTEDLRGYDQCFCKCACLCDYLKPCSRWIRKSNIFWCVRAILILVAIYTFALGMTNLSRCPMKNELPILIALLGAAGTVLLCFSLVLETRSSTCPNNRKCYLTAGIITIRLMFLGLFVAVLNATYSMSPSFDPSNPKTYCNEMFYNYVYNMNFVISGIVVLAFFIYAPCIDEEVDDYERF